MTLWELLVVACGVSPIMGAMNAARALGGGVRAYVMAVIVGASIGICCALASWFVRVWIIATVPKLVANRWQNGIYWLLALALVVWVAISTMFGEQAETMLVSLLKQS
jgi:hypothetical protein